uniref:TLC domain-containing protein n=1 Tax=Mesocestoides corti TaxID=53468 RepID=A0A5K3G2U9_MESCO
ARATPSGAFHPSPRAGHAAHYILHLIHVLLWMATFLSRMPLDCRGTRDWLRPGGPICLRPIFFFFCLPLRSEAALSFRIGSPHSC